MGILCDVIIMYMFLVINCPFLGTWAVLSGFVATIFYVIWVVMLSTDFDYS